MAKETIAEEVRVLRFFEAGPMEKVEAVFSIVCAKMQERLKGSGGVDPLTTRSNSPRGRRPRASTEAVVEERSEATRE